MYGLPSDFDYSVFQNQELTSVGFYSNMIALTFETGLSIRVESSYSHQFPGGSTPEVSSVPPSLSTLKQLIGRRIESACEEFKGTLVLCFEGLHTLRVFDDNPMYECYSIHVGGRDYYV